MVDTQNPHVPEATSIVFKWIGSALGLLTVAKFASMDVGRISVYHCLMHLGHYQFAVAHSFDCLQEAEEDPNTRFERSMRKNANVHLFAVSAHGFWRSLTHLERRFGEASISASIQSKADVIKSTKKIRDHLEHLVERFEIGRPGRYGEAMSQETFSRAMGVFDGRFVRFGDEQFDVVEIAGEVLATGSIIAEQVEALVQGKVDFIMAAIRESLSEQQKFDSKVEEASGKDSERECG